MKSTADLLTMKFQIQLNLPLQCRQLVGVSEGQDQGLPFIAASSSDTMSSILFLQKKNQSQKCNHN